MKLKVMADNLAPALTIASRAVSKRATLPVLQNVRLGTDRDTALTIDGTDLNVWMHVRLPGRVEENGTGPEATTVNAKDLLAIAKGASREETRLIDLSVDKVPDSTRERVTIVTADGKRTLPTIEAEEFPVFSPPGLAEVVTFDAADLRRALVESFGSVAGDEARPILTGLSMKVAHGKATFCGADNYRLAITTAPVQAPVRDVTTVLRPKFVEELIRLLPGLHPQVDLLVDGTHLGARLDVAAGRAVAEVTLLSTSIDGRFPNYQQVVPVLDQRSSVTVPRQRFLDALKGAASIGTNTFRMTFDERGLTVDSSWENGEKTFESTIAAPYAGFAQYVSADSSYFSALADIGDERIVIWPGGPQSPIAILPAGRSGFEAVVMPVRIA